MSFEIVIFFLLRSDIGSVYKLHTAPPTTLHFLEAAGAESHMLHMIQVRSCTIRYNTEQYVAKRKRGIYDNLKCPLYVWSFVGQIAFGKIWGAGK